MGCTVTPTCLRRSENRPLSLLLISALFTSFTKPTFAIPTDVISDEAKPAPIWLWQRQVQETAAFEWVPFHTKDQEILEKSLADGSDDCVLLAGKKWEACLAKRVCRPKFWPGKSLNITRAVWFIRRWTMESLFDPLPEAVSDSVDAWLSDRPDTALTVSIHAENDYDFSVKHVGKVTEVMATYKGFIGPLYGALPLKRGPIPGQFEAPPMPPGTDLRARHLILAVHGIGEAFFTTMGGVQTWVDQISDFSKVCISVDNQTGTQEERADGSDSQREFSKVDVLPIQWHKVVHSKKGVAARLQKITLTTVPKMREMFNKLMGDVIYYSAGRYQRRILESVAQQMNAAVKKWREVHQMADSEPLSVSILGHSLGSVIAYDLVMAQEGKLPGMEGDVELSFAFENLFLLGSPVAFFLASRDQVDWEECGAAAGTSPILPSRVRTYNVMQATDPVAYRIEPLVVPGIVPDDDSSNDDDDDDGDGDEDEEAVATNPVRAGDAVPSYKGAQSGGEEGGGAAWGGGGGGEGTSSAERIGAAFVPYANTDGPAPHVAARVAMDALGRLPGELLAGNTQGAKAALHGAVETVVGVAMDAEAQARKEAVLGQLKAVNPSGERLDWVLQEGASRTMLADYLNALEAHMRYFDQEDLARFVVSRCDLGPMQPRPAPAST